jgi:hypothetical protein
MALEQRSWPKPYRLTNTPEEARVRSFPLGQFLRITACLARKTSPQRPGNAE